MADMRTELEGLRDYGIGLDVLSKMYGVNKSTLHYRCKKWGIPTKREFDTKYDITKQIYNEDIPIDSVTHSMDFYRLSNGSLQRKHHGRLNVRFEDNKIILLGMLVNVRTGKRYYLTWSDNKETQQRGIQLITKALMNSEDIDILQTDRVLKQLIKGCEEIGIKVVCYGKTTKHPYNTSAERQFGNISKCFYSILDKFESIGIDEARTLFESILEIYWEYNRIPLLQYINIKQLKAQRIAQPIPNTQPKEN